MNTDHKPLYSLTIGEFVALTNELIDKAIKEKKEEQNQSSFVIEKCIQELEEYFLEKRKIKKQ